MLLGRLVAVRIRQSHEVAEFETIKDEIQVKAAGLAKTLQKKTQNAELQKLVDEFDKNRVAYFALLSTIFDLIQKNDALIHTLAGGDLTVRFTDTGQETGIYAAMRDMTGQLQDMVGKVTQGADQVSSAAGQIAQGSADLSQRAKEQASALEETAPSMEELTSTVKQSADNAGQANSLAGAGTRKIHRSFSFTILKYLTIM